MRARAPMPSPSEKHLHTLPLTAQRRRMEITKIDDPAKRRVTFSKRREGLFRKASTLCELTGARAAVIVFSSTGRLHSFGDPSVEEIIFEYLRCNGDAMPPMSLREWVDWVEKESESCVTEEDFMSLILKYEAVLDCVRKKLKHLENNPSVKAGAGGDSGAEVDDYEVLYDDEIHSLLESFQASCPSLLAHFENCARNGDHDSFLTSPVNLDAGGGSSGVESIPMRSDLEDCGFDPDDYLNLSEEFVRDGFLIMPENLAVDDGSSGEEPTCSDLEGYGYNLEVFVTLEDLDVSLVI
ncbi:hypothetical protein NL676_029176 [Syzygium grande]|nr:hypothetical protein NL676_029176 [Syzygium grande]